MPQRPWWSAIIWVGVAGVLGGEMLLGGGAPALFFEDLVASAYAEETVDISGTSSRPAKRPPTAAAQDSTASTLQKSSEAEPRSTDALLLDLAGGMTPPAAKLALNALAGRKLDVSTALRAFTTLELYTHHRSFEVRNAALSALAALPSAPGQNPSSALFIAALSDENATVRATAAKALGARRQFSAEPHLIKLLLRHDRAAVLPLGQIGGPDTARSLAEMIGSVPDRMILETLGALLLRADFGPEPVRLQVVKTIGKMPGGQTLDILGDYLKETAKDKQRPSRIEAQKIVEQRTAK